MLGLLSNNQRIKSAWSVNTGDEQGATVGYQNVSKIEVYHEKEISIVWLLVWKKDSNGLETISSRLNAAFMAQIEYS